MDAQLVEELFSAKLSQLEILDAVPRSLDPSAGMAQSDQSGLVEQQVTVISKPMRERDRDHLRFVASQPCLACGRTPSDAHHIKFAEQPAMSRKVSDKFTVPVCRLHHRELHKRGDERAWWAAHAIDSLAVAANLWGTTRKVAAPAETISGSTPFTKRNGSRFGSRQPQPKNSETKPILRSETK